MGNPNLPPGTTLQDLEPRLSPQEGFWDKLDRAYDEHVERCLAEGRDWRLPQRPLRPCTYPARPVNGGSLRRALPKTGQWHYEPKYNGWRALVHAPSQTIFNRYGERLTIEREFAAALSLLIRVRIPAAAGCVEWFDCEALERRHGLGRGTLLVFDYVVPGSLEPYLERKAKLTASIQVHAHSSPPVPNQIYAVVTSAQAMAEALELYQALQTFNRQWRCPFYEGVVAKRADLPYPVQLRSASLEFSGWVKHRWWR